MGILKAVGNALGIAPVDLSSAKYAYVPICLNTVLMIHSLISLVFFLIMNISHYPFNALSINDDFMVIHYLPLIPVIAFYFRDFHWMRFFLSWYPRTLFIISLFSIADFIYRLTTSNKTLNMMTLNSVCHLSDAMKTQLLIDFDCQNIAPADGLLLGALNNITDHCLSSNHSSYCVENIVKAHATGNLTANIYILFGAILQISLAYLTAGDFHRIK